MPPLPAWVSLHLTAKELACKDGTPYPGVWIDRAVVLAAIFEEIRGACGDLPIRVGSAYRTEAHNARVGGAKHSQHLLGKALDLYPPPGMGLADFYKTIRRIALRPDCPVHGLGRYPTFVHVDIRDRADRRVTVWSGTRAWAELKE